MPASSRCPCLELFQRQDEAYRDSVLPPAIKARVSVEQATVIGWEKYVGATGSIIGMHSFGSSAPLKDLLKKFGFTPEKVLEGGQASDRHQQIGLKLSRRPRARRR